MGVFRFFAKLAVLGVMLGIVGVILLAAAVGGFVALDDRGELTRETIAARDADTARVEIELREGALRFGGQLPNGGAPAAGGLAVTEMIEHPDRPPEISYSVHDGQGRLRLRQDNEFPFSRFRHRTTGTWDVAVSQEIPLDLRCDLRDVDATLNLAGLPVHRLHLSIDNGVSTLDLTGERVEPLTGAIDVHDGRISILLPDDQPAQVTVHRGSGRFTADGLTRDEETRRAEVYHNDAVLHGAAEPVIDLIITIQEGSVSVTTSAGADVGDVAPVAPEGSRAKGDDLMDLVQGRAQTRERGSATVPSPSPSPSVTTRLGPSARSTPTPSPTPTPTTVPNPPATTDSPPPRPNNDWRMDTVMGRDTTR